MLTIISWSFAFIFEDASALCDVQFHRLIAAEESDLKETCVFLFHFLSNMLCHTGQGQRISILALIPAVKWRMRMD